MFWLPVETRYCLAYTSYKKEMALIQDQQTSIKKLEFAGEAMLEGDGEWIINDEMEARRQIANVAAFFKFGYWFEFITKSVNSNILHDEINNDCMLLYIRYDKTIAFESCDYVKLKELKFFNSDNKFQLQLERINVEKKTYLTFEEKNDLKLNDGLLVKEVLINHRKEIEIGIKMQAKMFTNEFNKKSSKKRTKSRKNNKKRSKKNNSGY
jgi:hypothetical protein